MNLTEYNLNNNKNILNYTKYVKEKLYVLPYIKLQSI